MFDPLITDGCLETATVKTVGPTMYGVNVKMKYRDRTTNRFRTAWRVARYDYDEGRWWTRGTGGKGRVWIDCAVERWAPETPDAIARRPGRNEIKAARSSVDWGDR